MSQALHETIDIHNPAFNPGTSLPQESHPPHSDLPGAEIGDHQYPPQSAQNQVPQGFSNFVDGSGHIFSMYLEMATEEDKKMAENWKADADGILIFTGLFSAAVASLISVSIQDLRQNPQDTSNFYLTNIYQATINPTASSSLPALPPQFAPPNYAVWVNALWFLSLAISLTCALLATLLQQWARRYLKVTQSRYSLHKRARIRAFFAEGVEKLLLPWAVEILPGLLHISLFLFFAGLVVFLRNIDLTIFKLVLSWVGVCTAVYGCATVVPIFRHDSPYYTSLSSLVWLIVIGIRDVIAQVCGLFFLWYYARLRIFRRYRGRYHEMLFQGMQRTAEETALCSPPEIDTRAFLWTLDCLDEGHELERFFSGLPGFRNSNVVKDPLPDLTPEQQEKLLSALIGLSLRTSYSDLLPEQVKIRRAVICRKAIGPEDITREIILRILHRIVSGNQYGPEQPAEIVRFVRGWDNGDDEEKTTIIGAIVSSVIARAQRRDDLWFAMAADEMGVSETVLRNHATHGNNLSFAILIHVVRQQFSHIEQRYWPLYDFAEVLSAASKFDVLDTSPELQHEFCALWNQGVRTSGLRMSWILRPIRNTYLTLHLHTDSAPTAFSASTGDEDRIVWQETSYPLCNIPGHHPDSTPPIHDVSTSTTTPRSVLHNNTALVPSFPPDAPSPSVTTTPVHVGENPMAMPLLVDMPVPATLYCAHQTSTESVRDSATSPDLAATGAARDNPSAQTMAPTTGNVSTATSSVPPPTTVSFQNNTAHSSALESSASPEPVRGDTAGPPYSILATASSGSPPFLPPAPELGGTPNAGLRGDEDTHDRPSVNRASQANTTTIVERPPPPTLLSANDMTIASPSQQGLDADLTGDPPPHPSHGQYEVV